MIQVVLSPGKHRGAKRSSEPCHRETMTGTSEERRVCSQVLLSISEAKWWSLFPKFWMSGVKMTVKIEVTKKNKVLGNKMGKPREKKNCLITPRFCHFQVG